MPRTATYVVEGQEVTLDEVVARTKQSRNLCIRRLQPGREKTWERLMESPETAKRRQVERHKRLLAVERQERDSQKLGRELQRSIRDASLPRGKRSGVEVKPSR